MKSIFKQVRIKMTHINKLIFIVWMALFLSACSSLNSEFECPMKPGIRCESLDQISARVDRGEINKYSNLISSCSGTTCARSTSTLAKPSLCKSYNSNLSTREPLRYGETVQHVW